MKFNQYKAYFLFLTFFVFVGFQFCYSNDLYSIQESDNFYEPDVLDERKDSTKTLTLKVDTLNKKIVHLQKDNADLHSKLEAVNKHLNELKEQMALMGSPVHAILLENIKVKTDSLRLLSKINLELNSKLKQEEEKRQIYLDDLSQKQKSLEACADKNEKYKNLISKAVGEILGNVDSMGSNTLTNTPLKDFLQPSQTSIWNSRAAFKQKFDPLLNIPNKNILNESDLSSIQNVMNQYYNNDFKVMHSHLYTHLFLLNFWKKNFYYFENRLIKDFENAPTTPIVSREKYLQAKIDDKGYVDYPSLEFAIQSAIKDPNYKYISIKK